MNASTSPAKRLMVVYDGTPFQHRSLNEPKYRRHIDVPGAEPLADRLRLWIEPRLRRDALAEKPFDDEVHRPQVRQEVARDGQSAGLGEQSLEEVDRERVREPAPRLRPRTRPRRAGCPGR